ncbi:MAG: glycosyltransferase, partial [Planctomycetota bacterium]
MTVPPRISFIIPVRNDPERLERCLASVASSAATAELPAEVIVVDNGSTDATPQVAREAGARVLSAPGVTVARLRNRGAEGARGAILAFVDADHTIGRGWAAAAAELLERPGVSAAGAPYRPPADGTWVQRTYDLLRAHPDGTVETQWLGSGNLAVRREAFEEAGGFDESLATCADLDLCRRLREAGHTIVADERLESVHHGDPATLGELFRAELWRGRDALRFGLRVGWSLRNVVGTSLPVVTLLSVLALVLSAALPYGRLVAALGAAGLLGVIGLRMVRMLRNARRRDLHTIAATLVVATVYEIARAFALLARPRR